MVFLAAAPYERGNELPEELKKERSSLEEWAQANIKDSKRDVMSFWALKAPAILAAASGGVWAHFGLSDVGVIMGVIASVCVIIDGIYPRGMLRNTHLRAYHDIRNLSQKILNDWRTRNPRLTGDNVIRSILLDSAHERERISKYVRDAETSLKAGFEHK